MQLQKLKIGDRITHYCCGNLIEAEVVETDGRGVLTKHEPIQWGRDEYTKTYVMPSTSLQKKWGGTDEKGMPCAGPETTPAAFFKGEPITSPLTN